MVPISQDRFEGEEDEGDVEPEDDAAAMDDDNEVGNHQVGSISENDLDVMSKTEALLEVLYPETNAASLFSAPNMAIFARAVAAVVGRILPLSLRQAMHKWDLGYWPEWRRATGLQGEASAMTSRWLSSVFSSNLGGIVLYSTVIYCYIISIIVILLQLS